ELGRELLACADGSERQDHGRVRARRIERLERSIPRDAAGDLLREVGYTTPRERRLASERDDLCILRCWHGGRQLRSKRALPPECTRGGPAARPCRAANPAFSSPDARSAARR